MARYLEPSSRRAGWRAESLFEHAISRLLVSWDCLSAMQVSNCPFDAQSRLLVVPPGDRLKTDQDLQSHVFSTSLNHGCDSERNHCCLDFWVFLIEEGKPRCASCMFYSQGGQHFRRAKVVLYNRAGQRP